jgi:hypothetical protein
MFFAQDITRMKISVNEKIYWGQETSTMDGGHKDSQIFPLPHLLLFPSACSGPYHAAR